MKKLQLKVKRNKEEYISDVETFSRLKFQEYVEQDGVRGVKYYRYACSSYDYPDESETFVLFPGQKKEWFDSTTDITGPTEWDCYITDIWKIELIETEV